MEKIKLTEMSDDLVKEYQSKKGELIRQRVRVIAEMYKDNPKELMDYFENENLFIAGIATSAYHFLTKEIEPIQSTNFGGIGAMILDSPMNLEFKLDQLHFAQIFGNSLRGVKLFDNAGWRSDAYENSLVRMECFDNAMNYSKLHDSAGFRAILKDSSMKYSTLSKKALKDKQISDEALYGSKLEE